MAHLGRRGGHVRECPENLSVHLSRIRLAGNTVTLSKTHTFCHGVIERIHLFVISIEQLEERGLRSGGASYAPETQSLQTKIEFFNVEKEILQPKRCSLPHRSGLRGLKMSESECG